MPKYIYLWDLLPLPFKIGSWVDNVSFVDTCTWFDIGLGAATGWVCHSIQFHRLIQAHGLMSSQIDTGLWFATSSWIDTGLRVVTSLLSDKAS